MKTSIEIHTRAFPVTVQDGRSGSTFEDTIILTKEHLQAAQMVGQSSTELIHRIYNRKGYKVLEIGAPEKRAIPLNLAELVQLHERAGGRIN